MTGMKGHSGRPRSANSTTRMAQLEHMREVVDLRKQGFSHQAIADIVGRDRSSITQIIGKWVKSIDVDARAELIAIESAKLDAMEHAAIQILRTFVPVLAGGAAVYVPLDSNGNTMYDEAGNLVPVPVRDHNLVLQALNTMLKIATRRAALFGLDAPAKSSVQITPADQVPVITFNVVDAVNGTMEAVPERGATLQDAAAAEGVTDKEFEAAIATVQKEAQDDEAPITDAEAEYLLRRYPQDGTAAPAAEWMPTSFAAPVPVTPSAPTPTVVTQDTPNPKTAQPASVTLGFTAPAAYQLKP